MSKILFLTRLYHPHIGGVEKHVKKISKHLLNKGHELTILTTKHDGRLSSQEKVDGVNVKRFKRPEVKFLGLITTWFWIFKNISLIKRSDIIHCHDVFIWYLPFRFLFPKKKVYTTFHGWEGEYPIPRKNILLKRLSANLSYKNICVGEYIEKYYGIKADEVIYGATDLPKKNFDKKDKKIVYIGRLEKDTGLETILRTLKKLDGYSVDFCGDGPLKNKCSKYGKVHGFVDPKKYLKNAKFTFVGGYLSLLEAFSYKSLAVAAYENELRKDYYEMSPFSEWMLISNSPKSLAKKIKRASKDQGLYRDLADGAFEWVKQNSWEKLADKYLGLWQIRK